MRIWRVCAGLFGLGGVMAGAVAAHAISDPHAAEMVKTAALYALIHAGVLVCWDGYGKTGNLAKGALTLGVIFFSGALILKYYLRISMIGDLAPAGGILLMIGWVMIVFETGVHRRS